MLAFGLGLAFFALAWLGIALTREMGRIAAVWFANAAAVAVILRSPRRAAPLLLAGVVVGNIAANLLHGDTLVRAAALSAANFLEIAVVVGIMRRYLAPSDRFDTGAVIGRFMAAATGGALVSGLAASGMLALLDSAAFGATLFNWFAADLLGLLIVASLLLSLPPTLSHWRHPRVSLPLARQFEQAALIVAIVGGTLLVFAQSQAALFFLLGPMLLLAALRLSLTLACFTILAASSVAIAATILDLGPIARFAPEPLLRIYALQSLMASMIALVLPVRALVVERNRLDQAFAQSERKFRRIAEASTAGVLHLDLHGRVTWASARWATLTGERCEATRDGEWMNAVSEDARSGLLTLWTRARATLQPVRGEYPAAGPGSAGDDRWFAVSIHPERDIAGIVTGFVIRIEDVTQQRIAEAALAESEHLYRLVTENVSDIVLRLGLDGTMSYVSSAARRILGYDPDMLVGRPLRDLVHGEDLPHYKAAFSELLATTRDCPDLRFRTRCEDGRFRWVEGIFRPVFHQETGEPVEFVVSIRDISRRHRTEQVIIESAAKLRESNRLITLAEDLAKVGHWRLDLEQPGFDYSMQVNRIVGISRRETVSARAALRLVVREDRSTLSSTLRRARRAERPCECEVRLVTPAGERRQVRVVIQADRGPGGCLLGLFGVVRDVTIEHDAKVELVKARDRANAAAAAKSHFLATMSHEIRTPMTGVLGMIDLLMMNPATPDRDRYLDMLKTSADLLMAILDGILDFSRIDSGHIRLEARDVDVDALVTDAIQLFERQAGQKGLSLQWEANEPIGIVRGDALRLRQVLSNLLSNAIKFSDRGAIVVRSAAREEADSLHLRIEVSDEGIGIDPALHDRLFDPFVQADESTSRRFGGTGLGLAICRRLIEAMGGSIGIESALGQGTTFWFEVTLPKGASTAARLDAAADRDDFPAVRSPSSHAALSLLVAEDNPVNQMLIGAMLRADGHHVTAVENGRLAVEAAAARAYDAIIMDMQMPEMDGLAATRAIRASGGPCAAIPILALTADASPERRRFYDGAGLSAFLTKPIDQGLLLDQLRAIAGLGAIAPLPRADAPQSTSEPTVREARPTPPLFDDRQVADLGLAVGQQRLDEMFALLDVELDQRPAAIAAAIERGDVEQVRRLAHSLKGAAGSAGAAAVAALAAGFEESDADFPAISAQLLETARRTRLAIAALTDRPSDRAANG